MPTLTTVWIGKGYASIASLSTTTLLSLLDTPADLYAEEVAAVRREAARRGYFV